LNKLNANKPQKNGAKTAARPPTTELTLKRARAALDTKASGLPLPLMQPPCA
jgi:hypothetical protein